jgi:hypothetical protein
MSGIRTALAAPKLKALLTSVLLVDIFEGYSTAWMRMIELATGRDLSDTLQILPEAIQMRLVDRIEVCFKRDQKFVARVEFRYDWEQFKLEVHQNGERMVLDERSRGHLMSSMEATVEQCAFLIRQIWTSSGANGISVLFAYDDEALKKYGLDNIKARLNLSSMTEADSGEYRKITVARSHTLHDPNTQAMSVGIQTFH